MPVRKPISSIIVMEHKTIKKINDKFHRVTPDEGYRLGMKSMPQNTYSDVVTKTFDEFDAVPV